MSGGGWTLTACTWVCAHRPHLTHSPLSPALFTNYIAKWRSHDPPNPSDTVLETPAPRGSPNSRGLRCTCLGPTPGHREVTPGRLHAAPSPAGNSLGKSQHLAESTESFPSQDRWEPGGCRQQVWGGQDCPVPSLPGIKGHWPLPLLVPRGPGSHRPPQTQCP